MSKLPDTSDEQLLLQIKQGSNDAFAALYERYWTKAFSDAYGRLRNTDQSKDIVQDIFVSIWIRRDSLEIKNFPAYLGIAVRNRVLKLIESEKSNHPFFDLLDALPAANTNAADDNVLQKEFAHSFQLVLNSLPPKRQLIFKLRFQEDRSTQEIATALKLSRNTVQNQLRKAIDQLKVLLSHILLTIIILASHPRIF